MDASDIGHVLGQLEPDDQSAASLGTWLLGSLQIALLFEFDEFADCFVDRLWRLLLLRIQLTQRVHGLLSLLGRKLIQHELLFGRELDVLRQGAGAQQEQGRRAQAAFQQSHSVPYQFELH
jgi:hypothetical protein